MIKILILILSLSFRTANLPEQPFDYEIEGGLRGTHNRATMMIERENGSRYTGRNILLGNDRFEFSDFVKTAKRMNYQRFSAMYPLNKFSIGLVLGLEKWGNPDGLASIKYKNKYVKFLYAKGLEQEIAELDIMYEYKLSKRISLIPLARLRHSGINTFWQCKGQINININ